MTGVWYDQHPHARAELCPQHVKLVIGDLEIVKTQGLVHLFVAIMVFVLIEIRHPTAVA